MGECVRCKNANAENTYRYAIVATKADQETQNYIVAKKTTTTVYEQLVSFERSCVCNSCIKKERRMYTLKWTGFIALFILAALSVGAMRARSIGLWFPIVLAIGSLIGAVSVFFYARSRKDAFFASDIRANIASKKTGGKYRFVPVNASLYCPKGNTNPDLKLFKEKGGLRTRVADQLFEKFVLPGNGDEQIDSIIDSNN